MEKSAAQIEFECSIEEYKQKEPTYRDKVTLNRIDRRLKLSRMGLPSLVVALIVDGNYTAAKLALSAAANVALAASKLHLIIKCVEDNLKEVVLESLNPPESPHSRDNTPSIAFAYGAHIVACKPLIKLYKA